MVEEAEGAVVEVDMGRDQAGALLPDRVQASGGTLTCR